jgi:hypothetical protein
MVDTDSLRWRARSFRRIAMVSEFRRKVAGTAEAVCRKTGGKKREIELLNRKLGRKSHLAYNDLV